MKYIPFLFFIIIYPLNSLAQEEGHPDNVVMYNYKLPVPMVYIHKKEMNYIGLDGSGEKTMYEFSCPQESVIPDYKYFSEKYLKEMDCNKSLNQEFN